MDIKEYAKQNGFNPDDLPYAIDKKWGKLPIIDLIRKWEKTYGKKYPEQSERG